MACVKATVTLSKVLSTSARGARCFGEDCCGGVSFCEGEGVIGGGVIGGIEIESRGVIDGDDGDGGGGGIGSGPSPS